MIPSRKKIAKPHILDLLNVVYVKKKIVQKHQISIRKTKQKDCIVRNIKKMG